MKKQSRAKKRPTKPAQQLAHAIQGQTRRRRLGLSATYEESVPFEWTIQSYDPRLPPVLSTPAMIGMMEVAAAQAVMPELPPGAITVGTRIEVDHLKAVPMGANVIASARLVKYRGRFLVFDVEARSGDKVIGRGRVFRAIVEPKKFHANAESHL
jgi:fluoroacetyl-CoA thioesterase